MYKYDALVKSPNMGTSGMHEHLLTCGKPPSKRPLQQGQSTLKYQKIPKQALPKGLDIATKLFYQDHIPIYTVARSEALQSMFNALNFSKISYHTLNKPMDEKFSLITSQIGSLLKNRATEQFLTITFDKWPAQDGKKYIGVYVHVEEKSIRLGLILCKLFCGSEEIAAHLRKLLDLFGLIPSDITVSVTDCSADVQNVADIFGWFSLPCLAHVINLCVKNYFLQSLMTTISHRMSALKIRRRMLISLLGNSKILSKSCEG